MMVYNFRVKTSQASLLLPTLHLYFEVLTFLFLHSRFYDVVKYFRPIENNQ